ncbi:MAG TPA: hypothetical protein VJS66_05545 [Burkholderiales bacterium]|nr:hypothetical protein [Burkholderiales bacterium]
MLQLRRHGWLLVLFAPSILSACGLFDKGPPKTNLASIAVIAEDGANQNSASALDLVFVYDPAVAEFLPKTGPAWFESKASLLSGSPRALDVVSLQIPPSFALDADAISLPKRYKDAIRVMAYANYIAEDGRYPINLTELRRAVIRLKPAAIEYGE